jgi:hypothetical protein
MNNLINKEIEVNAYNFTGAASLKSYPQKITVEQEQVSFTDLLMQYVVKQGQHLIRLFDVTDGISTYRLRNEDGRWTLVSQTPIHI